MIIEKLIDFLFLPLNILISLLPESLVTSVSNIHFPQIVRWGACFFPLDVAIVTVSMFITWYMIFMAWAVIEWVYKKIPGVS